MRKPSKPPTMACRPFMQYQRVTVLACSSFLYQMAERAMKAGWQTHSKQPSRIRRIKIPVKL